MNNNDTRICQPLNLTCTAYLLIILFPSLDYNIICKKRKNQQIKKTKTKKMKNIIALRTEIKRLPINFARKLA